jgi:hypothetical protein
VRKLRQRFYGDCFPTCVAMIKDIPHNEIIKIAYPNHKKGSKYKSFFLKDCKRLLNKIKLSVTVKAPVKKLTDIKTAAILSIVWKTGRKSGHAVVWDPVSKKIYDPLYKYSLRHSLYVNNMRWYLEVR